MNSDSRRETVSVVIETVNEETDPVLDLESVLEGLSKQTYGAEQLEIIIVVAPQNTPRASTGSHNLNINIIESQNTTYYGMKTTGIAASTGDIVALLDSDCVPSPHWCASFVSRIRDGADVVAGKTRYPKEVRYAQTFNFFNFGYIHADENGIANSFLPNNVAFRREVIQKHQFAPGIKRGGAGHLLGAKLKSLGYVMVYEPNQSVTHNMYDLGEEFRMRIKSGYDTVNLSSVDKDKVLDETRYHRMGWIALPPIFLRRVIFDYRLMIRNRTDLDLSILDIPYFLILSPSIRAVEMVSSLITLIKPSYFKDKYDW